MANGETCSLALRVHGVDVRLRAVLQDRLNQPSSPCGCSRGPRSCPCTVGKCPTRSLRLSSLDVDCDSLRASHLLPQRDHGDDRRVVRLLRRLLLLRPLPLLPLGRERVPLLVAVLLAQRRASSPSPPRGSPPSSPRAFGRRRRRRPRSARPAPPPPRTARRRPPPLSSALRFLPTFPGNFDAFFFAVAVAVARRVLGRARAADGLHRVRPHARVELCLAAIFSLQRGALPRALHRARHRVVVVACLLEADGTDARGREASRGREVRGREARRLEAERTRADAVTPRRVVRSRMELRRRERASRRRRSEF